MISNLAARACPVLLMLACSGAHAQGWLETRIAIEEFAVDEDYEAAFDLGDELVAQAEAEFGATSTQLVDAHLLLASLYRQQSNFDDSELHLLRAIGIVELRDGEQSMTLIRPLLTLGDTYFEAGSYPEALATYEEARSLGRREFGVLNSEQIGIVQQMSAAALLMGDYEQARALQHEIVSVVQRANGEHSIEAVEAQFRLAAWYLRNGKVDEARDIYSAIENIVRVEFADDPLLAIRILRRQAVALRNGDPEQIVGRTSPKELQDALAIAATLEERNPLLEAEILRDIGDWYVSLSEPPKMAAPYTQAWALLDSVERGFEYQHDWFGPLTLITAPEFNSRYVSRDPDAPWGRIEIAFTLDTEGRARRIRIAHSDPPGLLDDAAIRQIRASRFRPRMEDGALIESQATVGWDFRYDEALLPAVTAGEPAAE